MTGPWWEDPSGNPLSGWKLDPVEAIGNKIAEAAEAMKPEWQLPVVCSNKGQHKELVLGRISRQLGATEYEFHHGAAFRRDHRGYYSMDAKHGNVVRRREEYGDLIEWRCLPPCRRYVPWRWDNAQQYAAGLEKAWTSNRLDISAIGR